MRRLVSIAILLLLALAVFPVQGTVHSQGSPSVEVNSVYTLNSYGFATVNETVTFTNNSTSSIQSPQVEVGLGNLSSMAVACSGNYSQGQGPCSGPAGGPYSVTYPGTLPPGISASVEFSVLLNGVVSTAKNGSLEVFILSSPSVSTRVSSLDSEILLPASTLFSSAPAGFTVSAGTTNTTYSMSEADVFPQTASTTLKAILPAAVGGLTPIRVFYATRTISVSPNGEPVVTDEVKFENVGTTPLTSLSVALLAPASTKVTVLTTKGDAPVLQNSFKTSLSGGAISLASIAIGYPSNGVQAGDNFTIRLQYPLGSSYYTTSGGKVTVNIPETAPVKAFLDSYSISLSVPQGAKATEAGPGKIGPVTPWQGGETSMAYVVTAGWFLAGGVPVASVVFLLLLLGLFVARTTTTATEEAAEEEEESSSELASAMIQAFDEKTNVINAFWPEISAKDPNDMDKAYFDELRGRLDSFRSRALQRLNETRQRSGSQKFYDVVNQIQGTEREVDRAAKDKLNLYQQYHLRQMRKEVFERLLPQYTKRLERALNQLSDELHTVQREAKLL